ncbi:MAG: glutamine synthetase adenylyltransferase, partial [Deinococcus sp.]|nr:glutamine synthetase adenylyltransferase [Deinococcus sp.]
LANFDQFIDQVFAPEGEEHSSFNLLSSQSTIDALARLFGASGFLWEDFLRFQHQNLLPLLADGQALQQRPTRAELEQELHSALAKATSPTEQRTMLNRFKDQAMLRIDLRHMLGHSSFPEFSQELSELAEIVISGAVDLANQALERTHGRPLLANRQPCPLAVFALGKCGGQEMGYASDVELSFVYSGDGHTTGPRVIPTPEYFEHLVKQVSEFIEHRREGIFQLDLRLRPYGNQGPLASPLAAFQRYYQPGGGARQFERQALVKMRCIAGDPELAQQVLAIRDQFVYGPEPFDPRELRHIRTRQVKELVPPGRTHAKYSPGALVDVEYLIQYLQILHGQSNQALRTPNTVAALQALYEARVLDAEVHHNLYEGYLFLRHLINALRIVRGNAKDLLLPLPGTPEFAALARRLGFGERQATLEWEVVHQFGQVEQLFTAYVEREAG